MKFNPVPFMFLPGVGLGGYFIGDWPGVTWALAMWTVMLIVGTVVHVVRHLSEKAVLASKR